MARPKKVPELNLPQADELFTTQEERDDLKREKVLEIPLSDIDDFPDHPFQVKHDESMQAMVDSIRAVGIQTPAVVRLKEDGRYEMVSGHRRKLACGLAGLESLPCIARDMSQDEAIIAMVDSNLQREIILPSEKARSYRMKLEAMKRQAGRPNKNNVSPLGTNLRSDEELAQMSGDSRTQIHRFIRLTELTSQLLDMVDEGQLSMRPAVEVSNLSQEHQQALMDAIEAEDRPPSHAQAAKMRKFSEEGSLSNDMILSIMREDKPSQTEHFKFPRERINRFFTADASPKEIEETIIKALELWQSRTQ